MFANLQIRPGKTHRRKPSLAKRAAVAKRRVSTLSAASVNNVPSMSFMEDLFGNEFPEAFGHGKTRKTILDLPAELLSIISADLSKLDIKRLRLASRRLAANVDLRIDRVYISPNRANLDRLQWILEHPRYRTHVREIVWDDAQLEEYPSSDKFELAIWNDERKTFAIFQKRMDQAIRDYEDRSQGYRVLGREDFFGPGDRLTKVGKEILMQYDNQFTRTLLNRNATLMELDESYALYQKLYSEEQDLMKRGVDVFALKRALSELPALIKITLTSEVWRPWDLFPQYDTPFQRSLPPGFRKPSVWPWLGLRPYPTPAQIMHRDTTMSASNIEQLSSEWRGYSIVTGTLATTPNTPVREFVIDGGNEGTGISHQLFASPNKDLDRTARMFCLIPLQRLHLTINIHGSDTATGSMAQSGLLHDALAELHHLAHLDLNMNWKHRAAPRVYTGRLFNVAQHLPPSLTERLHTLSLRNNFTAEDDLHGLVLSMKNAREITFDNIDLLGSHHTSSGEPEWHSLFARLRAVHRSHHLLSKPNFVWIQPLYTGGLVDMRSRLVDEEIDAYVYARGLNPFSEHEHERPKELGWIIADREPGRRIRAAEWHASECNTAWMDGTLANEGLYTESFTFMRDAE